MGDQELLAKRRRQLRYRANHRGIKEMDIILGRYGDDYLEQMQGEELDQFENLMEENDRDLLQWFTAEKQPPEEFAIACLTRYSLMPIRISKADIREINHGGYEVGAIARAV